MTLWHYAIKTNVWLWFHILAGGLLAKVMFVTGASEQGALSIVLFAALLWEVIEFFVNFLSSKPSRYGNDQVTPFQHFFMDSVGDVFGAVIMAAIVLF